jgi:hypothetical protein
VFSTFKNEPFKCTLLPFVKGVALLYSESLRGGFYCINFSKKNKIKDEFNSKKIK